MIFNPQQRYRDNWDTYARIVIISDCICIRRNKFQKCSWTLKTNNISTCTFTICCLFCLHLFTSSNWIVCIALAHVGWTENIIIWHIWRGAIRAVIRFRGDAWFSINVIRRQSMALYARGGLLMKFKNFNVFHLEPSILAYIMERGMNIRCDEVLRKYDVASRPPWVRYWNMM